MHQWPPFVYGRQVPCARPFGRYTDKLLFSDLSTPTLASVYFFDIPVPLELWLVATVSVACGDFEIVNAAHVRVTDPERFRVKDGEALLLGSTNAAIVEASDFPEADRGRITVGERLCLTFMRSSVPTGVGDELVLYPMVHTYQVASILVFNRRFRARRRFQS